MVPRLSREVLKVVLEEKREAFNGASRGGTFSSVVDPVSSIVSVLPPISGATLVLHFKRPVTDERQLSIRKRLWDAGGVGPSVGTPSVGVSNPSALGD